MSRKHDYQLRRWKQLIEERVNSGMPIKSWCAANGIAKGSYYYWLAKLREEYYAEAASELPLATAETNTFVEIIPDAPVQTQAVLPADLNQKAAVILRGSVRIEILQDASVLFLQRLLEAVSC